MILIKIEFHMHVTKLALCQDHLKFAYWFWKNKIKSCEGIYETRTLHGY